MSSRRRKESSTRNGKSRDNFSQSALKILCRRAGGKCCKCGASTLGPVTNNPFQTINIGKGAHIAAAAPGGPRHDKSMTSEERSSATNGLWLCSNCHDQIDRDPEGYPTPVLHSMKKKAEARVRKELGVATVVRNGSVEGSSAIAAGVSAGAILKIRQAKAKFLECLNKANALSKAEIALGEVGFLDVEADHYAEEVGMEFILLLQQIVGHTRDPKVTLEVIRRLKTIADSFHAEWKEERMQLMCKVIQMILYGNVGHKKSRATQSAIALLKDLCVYKAVKEHNLDKIPQQVMREIRQSVQEETDAGPPAAKKRAPLVDEEEEEDKMYLKLMEELVATTDPEKAVEIEDRMQAMGFTTYVH